MLKLQEVWENADCSCPVYYEIQDVEEEITKIFEYNGDDPARRGADKVFSIRAEILPEIGPVIMCLLEV